MLSLAPATRTLVWTGLTASPGSFCLFWENRLSLLPTVTSVDPPGVIGAALASPGAMNTVAIAAVTAASFLMRMALLG